MAHGRRKFLHAEHAICLESTAMPDYCLMRCEPGMIRPNGRSRPEVSWMKPRFLDNAWGRVVSYIYRGDLPIDHSRLEQKVRPSVVGRNPWLFANTPAGANASALICSLVEMAKANGKEPVRMVVRCARVFTSGPDR